MTRNDIKALFPDATKDAIDQLLDINSSDIGKAMNKNQTVQDKLESTIQGLNEQVSALSEQVKTLTNEKESAVNDLKAQYEVDMKALNDKHTGELTALNDQLKTAQDRATVADTLTERVTELTQELAARDATIRDNSKQYKIKDELRKQHAKNADVVWKMLNVDKIEEDENGVLNGLSEQLDAIKESDSYLFDSDLGQQRGGFAGSPDIGGDVKTPNDAVNKAIRTLSLHMN